MKFDHDRRPAITNLVIWTMVAIWLLILLSFLPEDALLFEVVIGSLLAVCVLVIGISPLVAKHEIIDGRIIIRQAWHSRVTVPLTLVKRVQVLERIDKKEGVVLDAFNRMLVLTDSKVNGVRLDLNREIRAPCAFWKKVNVVIFDVVDPTRFMDEVEAAL